MHSRAKSREDQIIPEPNLEACPGPIWFTFTLILGATTELYDQTKVLLRKSFITGVSSLSPQMIRSILKSKYFGPAIEKILPVAKFPIPANFHDDVNGIFLRLVLSQDDGMMNLEMIALVARHLHVVRHDGQIDYYVSMFRLMLEGGKRFCKDRSGLMRKKMAGISASLHRNDPKLWVNYPRRVFKSVGKCFGRQEPDNVHDMARGYWLRLVKSSREGELFVAVIKAVGNNVTQYSEARTNHFQSAAAFLIESSKRGISVWGIGRNRGPSPNRKPNRAPPSSYF
ncbi:unnamed protein product [Bemisia tabaci]|uniref:Uncharacterized protein n=1 Tax=Bemisia tabaci TaxID=7038 RepID=A0A9P0EXU1_BEMTA|nr:unnamed protein product [Bemisia tabaci]